MLTIPETVLKISSHNNEAYLIFPDLLSLYQYLSGVQHYPWLWQSLHRYGGPLWTFLVILGLVLPYPSVSGSQVLDADVAGMLK